MLWFFYLNIFWQLWQFYFLIMMKTVLFSILHSVNLFMFHFNIKFHNGNKSNDSDRKPVAQELDVSQLIGFFGLFIMRKFACPAKIQRAVIREMKPQARQARQRPKARQRAARNKGQRGRAWVWSVDLLQGEQTRIQNITTSVIERKQAKNNYLWSMYLEWST